MTDIRFYHLQKQNLDQALPLILEKALGAGHRIIVQMQNADEVERMNKILWTYKPESFLPHGSKKNGHDSQQPIWLTTEEENPNNASVLILTQGQTSENIGDFKMCCELLNGHDEDSISTARKRWKDYQAADHDVTYWFQDDKGKWTKKS
jgi:DNA polymerase-3 subunit chi